MGNRSSKKTVEPAEQEVTLSFEYAKLLVIKDKTPPYQGFLVQYGRNGNKVSRIANLTPGNKYKVIMLMYSYKSEPPVSGGTYVVLQFVQSEKYVFARPNARNGTKLRVRKKFKTFTTPNAENITTTNDPRVFLMEKKSSDVMFSSCYKESKDLVITLFQNISKPADLLAEGNGPLESKRFQLANAITESEETDHNGIITSHLDAVFY